MTMNPATNPTNATNPPATCTLVAPLVAEVLAAAAAPDTERDAEDAIGVAAAVEEVRTDVIIELEDIDEDEDEELVIMVDEEDVVAPVELDEVPEVMVELPPMSMPVPQGMAWPSD
jgi:hypothetical protein